MIIITNIFVTRVIFRGLAAAADQKGDSVQLLGVAQDGRVEAIGQVLLVHCHQHFVKVYSPKHHRPGRLARSTFSTFVILEMYIHRLVITVLVVVDININSCLTPLLFPSYTSYSPS